MGELVAGWLSFSIFGVGDSENSEKVSIVSRNRGDNHQLNRGKTGHMCWPDKDTQDTSQYSYTMAIKEAYNSCSDNSDNSDNSEYDL